MDVKTLAWITGFALLAMLPNANGKTLAAYRDNHRVLLVFAASDQDPAYLTQKKLWKSEKAGFDDRQLVVLPVFAEGRSGDTDPPGELAKRFGVETGKFAVILIGKDGHDAYRTGEPVKAEALYERIDAMPMRREEMRRQRQD